MEKSAEDYTEICNTTQLVVGRNGDDASIWEKRRETEGGKGKVGRETEREEGEGEGETDGVVKIK